MSSIDIDAIDVGASSDSSSLDSSDSKVGVKVTQVVQQQQQQQQQEEEQGFSPILYCRPDVVTLGNPFDTMKRFCLYSQCSHVNL